MIDKILSVDITVKWRSSSFWPFSWEKWLLRSLFLWFEFFLYSCNEAVALKIQFSLVIH